MSLTVEQYIALSALSHKNPESHPLGGENKFMIDNTKEVDYSKLEYEALAALNSWILVNTKTYDSGMSTFAVRDPKAKESPVQPTSILINKKEYVHV